jgi:PAS domain S-box-containing protein
MIKGKDSNGLVAAPAYNADYAREKTTKIRKRGQSNELFRPVPGLGVSEVISKRADKRLNESEERFKAIAEATRDAIIVVDGEGRISYWNPAAQNLFGHTRQEVRGKNLQIVIPKEYHTLYQEALKACKDRGQYPDLSDIFESEAIKKDGKEFPVEVSVSTMMLSGEWYAVCVVRDITHWRRAQKEVGETLAKYQLMFERNQDAIILVDAETRRFLDVNLSAVHLYGYSKEEFQRMRMEDLLFETSNDKSDPRGSRKERKTYSHRSRDGRVFSVNIKSRSFLWKNRKVLYALVRESPEERNDGRENCSN